MTIAAGAALLVVELRPAAFWPVLSIAPLVVAARSLIPIWAAMFRPGLARSRR